MYDIFGKYGPIRQIRTYALMSTWRRSSHGCLRLWLHIVRRGYKVADGVVVFCFGPSAETPLRREEPPTWSTKTFLTPRTHVTTCRASTSATATWWSSTTTQTEYVEAAWCRVALHQDKRRLLWPSRIILTYANVIKKTFSFLITGFPEDGHKEERGTAEAPEREIRHQHRPSKVTLWKSCLCPYTEFWPHYP